MTQPLAVQGAIPYVFCVDAGRHGVREISVIDPAGHTWGFVQRLTP